MEMSLPTKRITACRLSLCVAIGIAGAVSAVRAAEERVPDSTVANFVAKRVQAWEPTAAERRFDDIGWVKDIRTAKKLAAQHQRPVFLFTHDGHMAIGRC